VLSLQPENDIQITEASAPFAILHDDRTADPERVLLVGSLCQFRLIEPGMRIASDDDVYVRHLRGKLLVEVIADVGEPDHHVGFLLQDGNYPLRGLDRILYPEALCVWIRRHPRSGKPEYADADSVPLQYDIRRDYRLAGRLVCAVRAHDREFRLPDALEHDLLPGEALIALELVIPECKGIVSHGVHDGKIRLSLVGHGKGSASEHVACIQDEHGVRALGAH